MKIDVIYNEDFLKGVKGLPDKSVSLIIADPPYNIGKADWDRIPNYKETKINKILYCKITSNDNWVLVVQALIDKQ